MPTPEQSASAEIEAIVMDTVGLVAPSLNSLSAREASRRESISRREEFALKVHRTIDGIQKSTPENEKTVEIVRALVLANLYPCRQVRTPQWHRDLFEKVRKYEEQKGDPQVQRALSELINASEREFPIEIGGSIARPIRNAYLANVTESEFGFSHPYTIPSVRAPYAFEKARLGDAFAYVDQYDDSYYLRGHVHMCFVIAQTRAGLLVRRMKIGANGEKQATLNGNNRYFLSDASDADGKKSIEELDWASKGIMYHISLGQAE